jgi:putative phosphoribosyl transferase
MSLPMRPQAGLKRRSLDDPFRNRRDAGRALARPLAERRWNDPVVLALPRGGVPVAAVVAGALDAPLDVLVVRKLGHPRQPELAIGAIAAGGVTVMNHDAEGHLGGVSPEEIDRIALREHRELLRRERLYRDGHPAVPVRGREAIVVDDGLATGASMRAAVMALRQLQPARIVVATPVGARESCAALKQVADEVVCVLTPEPFYAVGVWYEDFEQTGDDEVRQLLDAARHHAHA